MLLNKFHVGSRQRLSFGTKRALSFSIFDWMFPGQNNLDIQLKATYALNHNDDDKNNMKKESDNLKTSTRTNFKDVKPIHVDNAAKTVQEIRKTAEKQLIHALSSSNAAAAADIRQIIPALDGTEVSIYSLKRIVFLLSEFCDKEQKGAWHRAMKQVSSISDRSTELDSTVLSQLKKALETAAQSSDLDVHEKWAVKYLLQRFSNPFINDTNENAEQTSDQESQQESQQQLQKYQQLDAFLRDVSEHLLESNLTLTQECVRDMYNYVGIRKEQAQLLGFANPAEMVLSTRQYSVDRVLEFQSRVSNDVVTALSQVADAVSKDEIQLQQMLDNLSNKPNTKFRKLAPKNQEQEEEEQIEPLQLEQYVTLDGVLKFGFRLCLDLFNVSIEEDTKVSAWHQDVRLFHVYDASNSSHCLGSFFLDPYQRRGKLAPCSTTPMFTRTTSAAPVVCMSLQIEAPTWDTDPTPMTWEDTESFLRELGNVLQLVLLRSHLGMMVQAQDADNDFSKVLPKFMESWMFEKATLYSMMDASGSDLPLDERSIMEALEIRSKDKVFQLAELNYCTALEMKLFTDFDLKGNESMLTLQNRLASELIPHAVPDKKNAAPLLEIFRQNASGREISWYRYMLAEFHAAELFDQFKSAHLQNDTHLTVELRQCLRRMAELGPAADLTSSNNVLRFEVDPSNFFKRLTL